jgi:hypothetical protein
MAKKRRKPAPEWVKEKADAAERRAKGLPLDEPRVPIDPPELTGAPRPRRVRPPLVPPGEVAAKDGAKLPKYKREFAKQAHKLCELGATDRELAEFFGVTTVTIWRWRCEYKEFCNALVVGKKHADARVERSLYQRAVGYSYDAVKINQYEGTPVITPYVEHVPPDPGSMKLWLCNREPEKWRDKVDIDHSGIVQVQEVRRVIVRAPASQGR